MENMFSFQTDHGCGDGPGSFLLFTALLIFWVTAPTKHLQGQDPFFTHFYANESEFVPAMVGYRGAFSFNAKYKSQWTGANVRAFQSGLITVEESMPCSVFDYGLALKFDEEGDGRLRTYDAGFKLAGTFGLDYQNNRRNVTGVLNFRAGMALRWVNKIVDYSRFTFSDELDPKYGLFDSMGNDLPTTFIPPNDGRSKHFFAPGVGLVIDWLSNEQGDRPVNVKLGAALHNAYSIGGSRYGNEESLLHIGTPIPERWSLFLEADWIVSNNQRRFMTVTPLFLYQRQGELTGNFTPLEYFETGASFGLNQALSLGLFYHAAPRPERDVNNHWFTVNLELGGVISTKNTKDRIDLGLSYSSNFTGLKNTVGPILEVSLSYHLATSPACGWMGRSNEVDYNKGPHCPYRSFSRKYRKMYENIWSNLYDRK